MAFFAGNPTIGIGASVDLFDNPTAPNRPWKYNRAPYDALAEVMVRSVGAPATALRMLLTVGSDEEVQDSLVGAGGVAQNLPNRLTTEPITFSVMKGDVLSCVISNPGAGAIEVGFVMELTRKGP